MNEVEELINQAFHSLDNNPSDGLIIFEKLKQMAPHDAGIHAGLAITFTRLGRIAEARSAILESIEKNPDSLYAQEFAITLGIEPWTLPKSHPWEIITAKKYITDNPSFVSSIPLPKYINISTHEVPSISFIHGGKVAGQYPVYITPDNRVFRESTADENVRDAIGSLWIKNPEDIHYMHIQGDVLPLNGLWSECFYH
jgi:hypothetical protein